MPSRKERVELIKALQEARKGSTVITYLTSTRPGLEVQMAMDAVPVLYKHLRELKEPKRIDLFLHSNGGEGIAPWRIVTLIREFAETFSVLVPHHAFSAATLAALGADEVIMHPMGMLGPTDPTITTPYNPPNPTNPSQRLGISVEDVSSYISLVKDDVGIRHEDELVQAFTLLAQQTHPLALGAVKRSTSQSTMMGGKLLRLGSRGLAEHEEEEIIEKLTSRLYYHGHPINRTEAAADLGLKFVKEADAATELAMWNLYEAYSDDMKLDEEFQPLFEAYAKDPVPLPTAGQPASIKEVTLDPIKSVYLESEARSDARSVQFEVVLRREWAGELNANFYPTRDLWIEET